MSSKLPRQKKYKVLQRYYDNCSLTIDKTSVINDFQNHTIQHHKLPKDGCAFSIDKVVNNLPEIKIGPCSGREVYTFKYHGTIIAVLSLLGRGTKWKRLSKVLSIN